MGSIWRSYLSILILFFGLTACTSDKVNKHEDTWQFGAPEILSKNQDSSDVLRLSVAEATQHELSPESELRFSSTENVNLSIHSLCSRNSRNFEERFNFAAQTQLLLLSILPAQSFLGDDADSEMNCSFEFLAMDQYSSTQSFVLNGLKISNLGKFSNLEASIKLRPIKAPEKTAIGVEELDQLVVSSDLSEGKAELLCSDFVSGEQFGSINKVDWKKIAYNQSPQVLRQILQHFHQRCRIAVQSVNGYRTSLSSEFELWFPAPTVSVHTQTPVFSSPMTPTMPVLNVTVSNTSEVDEYFAIWGDGQIAGDAVLIAGTERTQDFRLTSISSYSVFSPAIDGVDVMTSTYQKYFTLKPGATASISISARNVWHQFSSTNCIPALPNGPINSCGGYLIFLHNPIRLERLLSPAGFVDSATPPSFDSIAIFKTQDHQINEMKVFVPTAAVHDWHETERKISN